MTDASGAATRLVEVFTRDRVSRLDPYVKWVRKPIAVLSLAAATSVLCGLYLHPRALVLAAGLAAALVTGVAWPWVSVGGLVGELRFDRPRVREGRSATATLVLRNRMPWAAWGVVVSHPSHGGPSDGAACAEGRSVTESNWDVVPGARGEYPGEAPRIASAFPFGIWNAARPLSVPKPLLVWPAVFPSHWRPWPQRSTGRFRGGWSGPSGRRASSCCC